MKKLNRKGFTLVELLVVLVILVAIMAIAIPSIASSVERSKQKKKDSKIELIISAAEDYVDRHKNKYTAGIYIIELKDMICYGSLTKEIAKDPFNEKYTLSGYVSYNKNTEEYTWKETNNTTYRLTISDSLTCN